ncbi:amino acid ABC transporter substrate-binding protein [Pusillimonas sp. CC-YST705]|uniref:Amino acid ABC transporter substrate-binding protein n=1 Tax=Mesopusillimonas faecipullorum TaxID=2755040 RepID=A0ABS8C9J2_9BURK|nr:amino acid ABC transporter substrate-binding protein [Mesopusillimonas faecipullorum]MCB5362703.1 amino acid ABC transporter substrate-binding protein [Mesopusillimonas faecipullorum]
MALKFQCRQKLRSLLGACLALGAWCAGTPAATASTLDIVRERGYVQCGVTTGFAGFSAPDAQGRWQGLDIDFCRAVAAAVLGDAERIRPVPLSSQQRFTALQSGEIDVLARNTTVTLTRETATGALYIGIIFYDGQGFLTHKEDGVRKAEDLDGATICMQTGTSNENTLADWARAKGIRYRPVVIEQFGEVVKAFAAGRCDVFSTDASGLASIRASRMQDPDAYVLLPEQISREPLGPFVRQGDDAWFNVVKWTFQAMLNAEDLGLGQANVQAHLDNPDPNVQRFLGKIPGLGRSLGLSDDWAYQIVRQVGNYGESFERNLGKGSPLGIERGLNALWRDGGLMYPLPMR